MKLGMIPKRAPISLAAGLEEDRAVGGLERLGEEDRHLVDAGPGLGVQPLDRDAERARMSSISALKYSRFRFARSSE